MTQQDKERIEKEAEESFPGGGPSNFLRKGYMIGATSENERLNPVRQPSFYRSPSDNYEEGFRDARKGLAELLKQERNKAIDEVIIKLSTDVNQYDRIEKFWPRLKYELEALKS